MIQFHRDVIVGYEGGGEYVTSPDPKPLKEKEDGKIIKEIIFFTVVGILLIFTLVKCNYDDGQYSRSLYMDNPAYVEKIEPDGHFLSVYYIHSHGDIYSFLTAVIDTNGKYHVGDTLILIKK